MSWYRAHKPKGRKPVFLGGAAIGVLLVVTAIAMIVIPSGAAGSTNKTLNCTSINPQQATAGTSVPFTLHLCNDSTSPNQMGSAQVTAPNGFVITGTSPLPTGSSFTGTTVLLMNLNLQPGQSTDITITATVPALCAPANLQWAIDARQSNNFSGQPGNKFSPDPAYRPASVIASCKLAFVNQPAETAATTPTETTKWGAIDSNNPGQPITVEVQAGGVHYSSPTGNVTIAAIGPNCSFTSDATTKIGFVNGYATFSNLKMATAAASCTLTATSDSGYITSDPSSPFSVDPVQLFFVNQPATAVVNTVLRDTMYGGTVTPPAGNPIKVGVEVVNQTNSADTLQFGGSGTVSMIASGTGCVFTSDSVNGNVAVGNDGNWTFSNLKMQNAPVTGCTLAAGSSSAGYTASASSNQFNVDQNGTICSGACDTGPIPSGDGNTTEVQANFTGTITVNFTPPGSLPQGVLGACGSAFQNSPGAGAASSQVILNPTSFSGVGPNATVIVNVGKKYLPKPPSQGNPFIPICAGAHRVALGPNPPLGTIFPCDPSTGKDATGFGGWITQSYQPAGCPNDGGGEFWGQLGAYNQNPRIPADSPVITSWTGNTDGSRTFTISLGTVQPGQNWYWDWHSQPA
jgi:hypothetical protein